MLVGSCAEQEIVESQGWKASYTAEECAVLTSLEGIARQCGGGDLDRALEVIANGDATRCLPYSDRTMMDGVWVRGFEYSEFFEGAETFDEVAERVHSYDDPYTWFSPIGSARSYVGNLPIPDEGAAFRVEIIGQKSLCDGQYGHGGASSSEVIVSHIIGATHLPITR